MSGLSVERCGSVNLNGFCLCDELVFAHREHVPDGVASITDVGEMVRPITREWYGRLFRFLPLQDFRGRRRWRLPATSTSRYLTVLSSKVGVSKQQLDSSQISVFAVNEGACTD